MGECGACENNDSGFTLIVNIHIEGDLVYEDQCTYVEHVYMDDEGMDLDFELDSDE